MKFNKNILDSITQFENIIGYRFNNKEFVNIKKGKYDLILTHKLFPMVSKSIYFNFNILITKTLE